MTWQYVKYVWLFNPYGGQQMTPRSILNWCMSTKQDSLGIYTLLIEYCKITSKHYVPELHLVSSLEYLCFLFVVVFVIVVFKYTRLYVFNSTDSFRFRRVRGCICISSYYNHKITCINPSHVVKINHGFGSQVVVVAYFFQLLHIYPKKGACLFQLQGTF